MTDLTWAQGDECVEGDPDCRDTDCPVHWCARWSYECGSGCGRPADRCVCL